MFDNSRSMELSRQYFTVLQLLRISEKWIDDNLAEWKNFCEGSLGDKDIDHFLRVGFSMYRRIELISNPAAFADELTELLKRWALQRDKVTQMMTAQSQQLRDRIDKKTEEVISLRDGVSPSRFIPTSHTRFLDLPTSGKTDQGISSCSTQPHSEKQ